MLKNKYILIALGGLMLITFAFGGWEPDVRLTNQSALSAGSYNNANKIAVSDSVVHVVWHDERDGNREIYYTRSIDNGVTWPSSPGGDIRLTNATRTSEYPAVAVSGNNVHVVWEDSRNQVGSLAHYDIFYKHSTDGGITWSNDTQLTYQPMGTRSIDASIAVCGDTIHLAWEDYRDDLSGEIYYKRSVDGGITWDSDVRLTTSSNFASWWPSIAVNGNNVHVVYRDSRDGSIYNHEIYYKRSIDGGTTWGSDVRFTTNTDESWNPSIAVVGDTVHVAWNDGISYPNNSHEIYYKRSIDNGTTWSGNTRLTYAANNSLFASITAQGSNVHIVWQDARGGSNNDIYYIHSSDNGTTWGSDTNLTNISGTQKYLPGVAAAGGNVHVVWRDLRDYSNGEMYYKRYFGTPPDYYTITATAYGPGVIIPSGSVIINAGEDTTFIITPNVNCQIDSLVVDNVNHGADSSYYAFTNVTTNHTIKAYFSLIVGFEELVNQYLSDKLTRIYPNPFSSYTRIRIPNSVSADNESELKIYNVAGKLVKSYNLAKVSGSRSTSDGVIWDGKDNNGLKVPDGIYIVNLKTGQENICRRLILVR